jgi:hypothetical protein
MKDYQSHAYNVNAAIEMLQDVDGETMEEIIRGVGMEGQMLRQLILSTPIEEIECLMEEKKNQI